MKRFLATLMVLVLAMGCMNFAFADADNYNLTLTANKDGDTLVVEVYNGNSFQVNNLTVEAEGNVWEIASIAAGETWNSETSEPGTPVQDFVPVGWYNGKLNDNPGYDNHCAVVADEEADWSKVVTAQSNGITVTASFEALGPRMMFVGNSQTYYFSSAPYFFRELAQMGGWNAQVAYSLFGGSTFAMIAGMTTMNVAAWPGADSVQPVESFQIVKNANDYYDFISFHALTDEPIRAVDGELTMFDDFMDAAKILDIQTRARGAKTLFMATWGYRNGYINDSTYLPDTNDPVGTIYEFDKDGDGVKESAMAKTMTRTEMEAALRNGYQQAADSVGADIVPVGEASEYVSANYPDLVMYYSDQKHPTNLHDYLTACVYYAKLFNESPVGLGIPPVFPATADPELGGEITEEDALIIQQVAAMIVLGE
ncbi:MAG: hypothetical protein Q4D04_15865 [Clostridia bacterium]|nr:hypothetical protein [Clostridia bacterium]